MLKQSDWDLAITAAAPAIWGSTYLVTSELLPPGRPLLDAVVRALPAGLVLTALTRRLPDGSWWWRAGVLGALNIGGFFALLFVAAYRLPGGVAATLGAVQPLLVSGLAAKLLGERLTWLRLIAGLAGLVGVGLLVLRAGARLDPIGVAAALAAAGSMACGVVLTKRWQPSVSALALTGWQLIAGGVLLVPLLLAVEGLPPALTVKNVIGLGYISAIGTGVAYVLWFRGLRRLSASKITFTGLVSPLVATALGWIALGQRLTIAQGVGVIVILTALTAAQLPSRHLHLHLPWRKVRGEPEPGWIRGMFATVDRFGPS